MSTFKMVPWLLISLLSFSTAIAGDRGAGSEETCTAASAEAGSCELGAQPEYEYEVEEAGTGPDWLDRCNDMARLNRRICIEETENWVCCDLQALIAEAACMLDPMGVAWELRDEYVNGDSWASECEQDVEDEEIPAPETEGLFG